MFTAFIAQGTISRNSAFNNVPVDRYVNIETLLFYDYLLVYFQAITLLLSTFKIWQLLRIEQHMNTLLRVLSALTKPVLAYLFMFLLLTMPFVIAGHVLFGAKLFDFSSLINSLTTLFKLILGQFDYDDFRRADPRIGPIYFFMAVFFLQYILMNVLLALIINVFHFVQERNRDTIAFESKMAIFLVDRVKESLGLRLHNPIAELQPLLADEVHKDFHQLLDFYNRKPRTISWEKWNTVIQMRILRQVISQSAEFMRLLEQEGHDHGSSFNRKAQDIALLNEKELPVARFTDDDSRFVEESPIFNLEDVRFERVFADKFISEYISVCRDSLMYVRDQLVELIISTHNEDELVGMSAFTRPVKMSDGRTRKVDRVLERIMKLKGVTYEQAYALYRKRMGEKYLKDSDDE